MPRNNPALPPTSLGAAAMTVQTVCAGQLNMVTFQYLANTAAGLTTSELATLIASWRTAIQPAFLACLPPAAILSTITAADISLGASPTQYAFLTAAGTVAASTPLPPQAAVCITRYTGTRGQHGRGRFYMPSIPSTFVAPATNPDEITPAANTAYLNLANLLWQTSLSLGVRTAQLAILTRPTPPATLFLRGALVSAVAVRLAIATQRRRRESFTR